MLGNSGGQDHGMACLQIGGPDSSCKVKSVTKASAGRTDIVGACVSPRRRLRIGAKANVRVAVPCEGSECLHREAFPAFAAIRTRPNPR